MNTTREKQVQVDEELSGLSNNISAVTSVAASVERTLGPKGLDTMLVDRFGRSRPKGKSQEASLYE